MITIKTGYEDNQKYSIDDNEAHKAYYLFLNPDKRGIFSNGLALIGKDIRGIEPDYQGTMGWNKTHELDNDDWADIRKHGVDTKLRDVLFKAKEVAYLNKPELLNLPLNEINTSLRIEDISDTGKMLGDKFKI